MKWTTALPTKPGFYWFKGHLGREGIRMEGAEVVHVLPTAINEDLPATVIVAGRNNKYGLHSCKGEWAGPIEPPK
jgi:hypothetical protein